MNRLLIRRAAAALLLCLVTSRYAISQIVVLTESADERWMRGNMHCHTLWSDGDDYPEMVAQWYRDHGYQFLVFTDHNRIHQGERWIGVEGSKGGRRGLERLLEACPSDWVVTRGEGAGQEVRLKTFDEVFDRVAAPQQFLLMQGEEISDEFRRRPIHLCAMNLPELLPPMHGDDVVDVMQRNVDAAVALRERTGVANLIHLNHPNFGYAVTAEQLMRVVGENFFEVYNGHPGVDNRGDDIHPATERLWDIMLTWRLARLNLPVMYGLATDDGHNYFLEQKPGHGAQPGRGWVMVLADSLEPDALVKALEAGRFYSSSGVTLSRIEWDEQRLHVSVQPQPETDYRIDFIGTRADFDDTVTPVPAEGEHARPVTQGYSQDVGAVLQTIEGVSGTYEFQGSELYVRALITASRRHTNPSQPGEYERAWVQPVRGPGHDVRNGPRPVDCGD